MFNRMIVITPEVTERVQQVKAYALSHREPLASLVERMGRQDLACGLDPALNIEFFDGFRVVYSVEQQPEPLGWCEHISISVTNPPDPKKPLPGPKTISILLSLLFGLNHLQAVRVWVEEECNPPAVNFVFQYKGPLP